jgi:serine/threonine-protein kinase
MPNPGQNPGSPASIPLAAETVRAQLNRILADPRFLRSGRHSNFLRYTVERTLAGAGGELKEYVIAMEVYGKSSSYDPAVDSIVRVEAARLRSKITEYYATTGRDDPVRIEFPRGTYAPVFSAQTPPAAPGPAEEAVSKPSESARKRPLLALPRNSIIIGTALLAATVIFLNWRAVSARRRSAPDTISPVAVLSFISLDPDPEVETFAAGLTDDVTNALSRDRDVRLAARPSTLSLQTASDSVISIGQQLHVGAVLEGSVRKEGNRLRITAQLIDAADGRREWAETYERENAHDPRAKADLSRRIAMSVLAEKTRHLAGGSAITPAGNEAREICRPLLLSLDRRGRDHLTLRDPHGEHHMTLDSLMAAVQGFERAIALDPTYSPAYGGLAMAYLLASDFDERLSDKARQIAIRGLQIDETLAEAHFTLGYSLFFKDWDFSGAQRELKRTLELNPRDVTAGRLYADCSALLGDPQSGVAALERVRRFVPNSPVIAVQLGIMLYHARRFSELEEYVRSIQTLHPDVALVEWLSGLALEQRGRYAEAASAFEKSLDLSPHDARATPALGHVYGLLGRRDAALKLIRESRDGAMKGWNSGPVGIALIYLGLGDRESSLTWLETAYTIREGALPYIKLDPRCDNLRSEPRFQTLLRKLRL